MLSFLKALGKSWKILTKNYVDVIKDIDKQTLELERAQLSQNRADIYNYLQRLIKLHLELFNTTWTLIIATISLIISIIALFLSVHK